MGEGGRGGRGGGGPVRQRGSKQRRGLSSGACAEKATTACAGSALPCSLQQHATQGRCSAHQQLKVAPATASTRALSAAIAGCQGAGASVAPE